MQYIFGPAGREALAIFCQAKTLFAFDYDGTLAPIVSQPHAAFMRRATGDLLRRLSLQRKVAVISGRRLDDLASFLPVEVSYRIGNHGFEGFSPSLLDREEVAATCAQWKRDLIDLLPFEQGLLLEDKIYSLSIHYRGVENPEQTLSWIHQAVRKMAPPPRVISGKFVVNLLLEASPDKGRAVCELMQDAQTERAVFVGDDDNDEDAFVLPRTEVLSVRVGERLGSAAAFYLRDQDEIDAFLALCLQFSST